MSIHVVHDAVTYHQVLQRLMYPPVSMCLVNCPAYTLADNVSNGLLLPMSLLLPPPLLQGKAPTNTPELITIVTHTFLYVKRSEIQRP